MSHSLSASVWERSGRSEISKHLFALLLGVTTLGGLTLTGILAFFTTGWMKFIPAVGDGKASFEWVGPIPFLVIAIGVLVIAIAGVFIALSSDNPMVSLLGYALVAGPFGVLLGPTIGMYTAASVAKVILVTGLVVGVLTLIGVIIPDSLESWGIWLLGGLSILLLGQLGIPLVGWLFPNLPIHGALTIMDWLGVLLFSAYIIFDMNRAMRVPKTVDNAVDCSLAIYLDIINLFIRLLAIMGKKKSD